MLDLTTKLILLYILSFVFGNVLVFMDIKSGKADKYILSLLNNSKYNLIAHTNKEKLFSIYKYVNRIIYILPIINTIVLFLHLINEYTENRK